MPPSAWARADVSGAAHVDVDGDLTVLPTSPADARADAHVDSGPPPLSQRGPRRILVAGSSGSGKTTLARRIGVTLDIPHVELDALFHGPGWTRLPDFEEQVRLLVAQPAWVTEWQYTQARPLLARSADLLVWLDLPRAVVMRQVVARTVSRRLRRTPLWNGNVEGPLWRALVRRDSIIRWAWRTHHQTRELVRGLAAQRPDLPIVHLTSHAQAAAWVEQLTAGTQDPQAGS